MARVAELLLGGIVPASQPELVLQPHHRDVVRALAELAAQQRAPERAVGVAAHVALDPLAGRDTLERAGRAGPLLDRHHAGAEPQAGERRAGAGTPEVQ